MDVLGATATRREAKSYLSRFRPESSQQSHQGRPHARSKSQLRNCGVNLGNLYLPVRSIEESPVFSQTESRKTFTDPTTQPLRTALVLLKASETDIDDETLRDVGRTLLQLSRLGLNCVVVVDGQDSHDIDPFERRRRATERADRIVAAIEETRGALARRLDGILNLDSSAQVIEPSVKVKGDTIVAARDLLLKPLSRGVIPVVAPVAFDNSLQKTVVLDTKDTILTLTRDLAGLNYLADSHRNDNNINTTKSKPVSLDRIIILDPRGGIPSINRSNGSHVFVNIEQEYEEIQQELSQMQSPENSQALQSHASNLELARDVLAILPPTSSAFITTPTAASTTHTKPSTSAPGVGTRTRRNALIHNLLTDKPVFSSSLPVTRLVSWPQHPSISLVDPQPPTFLKRGLPITIFPDPRIKTWSPPTKSNPAFPLSDPSLDLPRLIHLIEDSFGRKLDARAYFERIAPRLAGIIVAGAYEGGAILTWETPPGIEPPSPSSSSETSDSFKPLATDPSRLVPYLDKFAVLQRSQGAGGVADVVFNAMTRECFPLGVAWRSRSANPVNKWYFERARGSWKIPVEEGKQGWTVFWTTDGVGGEKFTDYEGVCRKIGTNWADGKARLD